MHEVQDQASLEMARRVAQRLRADPALLNVAQQNIARWLKRNGNVPSLVRNYREWERLLDRSLEEICRLLESDTQESQRLRQNSPFAGILPPSEVWAIKAEIRQRYGKISP